MFNEREALRLRLEQLNEAEVKVMREYQIEREKIYSKLRELDTISLVPKKNNQVDSKNFKLPVLAELAAQELRSYKSSQQPKQNLISSSSAAPETSSESKPRRRGRIRPNSKAAKLREIAIRILKRHNASIKSSELQKEIEKESGTEIPNMTMFMQGLIKMHPEVKKPYRGQYIIVNTSSES
ncbi:Rok-like winged helix domain-containing protein [Bacillus subtilis]|uniref:Rok-like winged helix domain-containing protein n=1 Tax=Bacillus subtilis TaxID=1423 RepID=UPI0013B5D555|nr:hypothetical protein [Bacillus subtilis]KAF2421753.1 hypothetical protein B6K89_21435 [Bacillus subtilis]